MSDQNQNLPDTQGQYLEMPKIVIADPSEYEETDLDLNFAYWTPLAVGESKACVFLFVKVNDDVNSFDDPQKIIQKDCAYFAEIVTNKETGEMVKRVFRCAQSVLVSAFKKLTPGGVYKIEYAGKVKTKKGHSADNFIIKQMMPKQVTNE